MDTDPNDVFMWEDPSNFAQQLKANAMRVITQPPLRLHISRRNVKVPHQKSKKLQQLQSKPRDPNASSSLLMIAPPSDRRYRTLNKFPHRRNPVTSERQEPSTSGTQQKRRKIQPVLPRAQGWLEGTAPLDTPNYHIPRCLQHISTFSTMTRKRGGEENLRKGYEQTPILTQDPFPMIDPYTSSYMTSSNQPSTSNKIPDFSGLRKTRNNNNHDLPILTTATSFLKQPSGVVKQPSGVVKQPLLVSKNVELKRQIESTPLYCACALCQMAKQAQLNIALQRCHGRTSKSVTSRYVAHDVTSDFNNIQNCDPHHTLRHNNLKRTKPPDDGQPSAKKFIISQSFPQQQLHEQSLACPDAALQFLSTRTRNQMGRGAAPKIAPNMFFSSIQLPMSSASSSNHHNLIMTPSFDNQNYVTSQVVNPNAAFGGGIFNGIANFLPQQILNALE